MLPDYTGPEGGRLAAAFAAGCLATWTFMSRLVMRPALKSCEQRITDLEDRIIDYREQRAYDRARISQLETILLTHGSQDLRNAMQAALSEARIETDKVEGKL